MVSATAFGLGPLPGTDVAAAADVVLSESPTPHLPQLPGRGVGSDLVGRTAVLLPIPVDIGPRGWRATHRPQLSTRTARDQMERDLDQLEELWAGNLGTDPVIKVQLVGPWTLAAEIEMPNGHRMITDRSASQDIAHALAHGVEEHRRDVEKRFAAATILQLDEPALTHVRAGAVKGATDYEEIPAVADADILERLRSYGPHLLNAPDPLYGADWFTLDPRREPDNDALGAALDRGARIAVPTMQPREVFQIFDELQIDPAQTLIDVTAATGPTLVRTAAHYRAAAEMAGALGTAS